MLIILIGGAIVVYYYPLDTNDIPTKAKPIAVNVIRVEKSRTYERKHAYLGKISAKRTSNLSFEIAGAINGISVEEGDSVTEGQALATLDAKHLIAKKQEIVSEIHRIEALFELTKLTRDRMVEASSLNAVSETDKDQADQNFAAHAAALKASQAKLLQVNIEIDKALLKAPFSGYIAKKYLDEGTVVQEGSPVLKIVEINNLEARIGVTNPQAVKIGEKTELHTRHGPAEATVLSILPIRDAATRNVEIICSLKNPYPQLRPGDAATIFIIETVEKEGVWLPITALTESSRGLWAAFVALPQEDSNLFHLVRQELEVIDQTSEWVYVKAPFNGGELVVKNGLNRVMPGLDVTINKSE